MCTAQDRHHALLPQARRLLLVAAAAVRGVNGLQAIYCATVLVVLDDREWSTSRFSQEPLNTTVRVGLDFWLFLHILYYEVVKLLKPRSIQFIVRGAMELRCWNNNTVHVSNAKV